MRGNGDAQAQSSPPACPRCRVRDEHGIKVWSTAVCATAPPVINKNVFRRKRPLFLSGMHKSTANDPGHTDLAAPEW